MGSAGILNSGTKGLISIKLIGVLVIRLVQRSVLITFSAENILSTSLLVNGMLNGIAEGKHITPHLCIRNMSFVILQLVNVLLVKIQSVEVNYLSILSSTEDRHAPFASSGSRNRRTICAADSLISDLSSFSSFSCSSSCLVSWQPAFELTNCRYQGTLE